ncbi:hypothetical protein FQR65_LT15604 [Abscondita terminalis]|nr:hypothetical protein FQR65_LT15604 [Abscondita terminalis]
MSSPNPLPIKRKTGNRLYLSMTDGIPTDDGKAGLREFQKTQNRLYHSCAAGSEADTSVLKQITENVVSLDTADSQSISKFFAWVTASIGVSSTKVEDSGKEATGLNELPPPPTELNIVVDVYTINNSRQQYLNRFFKWVSIPLEQGQQKGRRNHRYSHPAATAIEDLVYFLIDVSESWWAEPISAVEEGCQPIIQALKTDPVAMETEIIQFYPPKFPIGSGTSLSKGLGHLMYELRKNTVKTTAEQKGDWSPLYFYLPTEYPQILYRQRLTSGNKTGKPPPIWLPYPLEKKPTVHVLGQLTISQATRGMELHTGINRLVGPIRRKQLFGAGRKYRRTTKYILTELIEHPPVRCCGNQYAFAASQLRTVHCVGEEALSPAPGVTHRRSTDLAKADLNVNRTQGIIMEKNYRNYKPISSAFTINRKAPQYGGSKTIIEQQSALMDKWQLKNHIADIIAKPLIIPTPPVANLIRHRSSPDNWNSGLQ